MAIDTGRREEARRNDKKNYEKLQMESREAVNKQPILIGIKDITFYYRSFGKLC